MSTKTPKTPEKPITPYSKRERRTAKHLTTFTPSALEKLTEVAEASGVSRNEAILQACEIWVEEREERTDNKVKISVPLDVRKLRRLTKLARMTSKTVEQVFTEAVNAKLEESMKFNRYLRDPNEDR